MPQNVELKATVTDGEQALALARAWCDGEPHVERQIDTYFEVPRGRLKIRRRFERRNARASQASLEDAAKPLCDEEWHAFALEWIQYDRADSIEPRPSTYRRVPHPVESALEELLRVALPVRCVVDKVRWFWIHDEVRIHLDVVVGLGWFLEFEAMVQDDSELPRAHEKVAALTEHFQVAPAEKQAGSYSDLLLAP